MARIPSEVWRFCVEQIKLYPIHKASYEEQIKLIETAYTEGGGSTVFSPVGRVQGGGPKSPVVSRFEWKEEMLNRPDLLYQARCIACLEEALAGLDKDKRDIVEVIWQTGWRDNELIAARAKVSVATVKRVKRELVEKLAVRWGLWVKVA